MENIEVKKEIKMEPDSFQPTIPAAPDLNPVSSFPSVTHAQLAAHSQLVAQSKPGTQVLFMTGSQSGSGLRSGSNVTAQPQMIIFQSVPYSQLVASSKTLLKLDLVSGAGQEQTDSKPVIFMSGAGQEKTDSKPVIFMSGAEQEKTDSKPVISLSGAEQEKTSSKPVISLSEAGQEKTNSKPVIHLVPVPRHEVPDSKSVISLSGGRQVKTNSKPVISLSVAGQEKTNSKPVIHLVPVPKHEIHDSKPVISMLKNTKLPTASQSKSVSCLQTGLQQEAVSCLQTGLQQTQEPSLQTGSQQQPMSCLQTGSQQAVLCLQTGSQEAVSALQTGSQQQPVLCKQTGSQTCPVPHLQTKTHTQDRAKAQPVLGTYNVATQTRRAPKPQLGTPSASSPTVRPVSLFKRLTHCQLSKSPENPRDMKIVFSKNSFETNAEGVKVKMEKKASDVNNSGQDETESKAELRNFMGLTESGLEAEPDSKADVREKIGLRESGSVVDIITEVNDEESQIASAETAENIKTEVKSESEMEEDDDELSEYESIDEDFIVFKDDLEEEEEENDSKSKNTKRKFKKITKKDFVTFRYDSEEEERKRMRSDDSDEDYQPSVSEDELENSEDSDSDEYSDSDTHDLQRNGKIYDGLEPKVMFTPDGDYSCTYCVQVYSTMEEAEAHILTHYEYPCENCDEKFLTPQQLNSHNRLSHRKQQPSNLMFLCMVSGCEHMSVSKVSLLKHIGSAHESEKSFTCAWCSKSSRTVSQFKTHIQSAHLTSNNRASSNTDYLCESCGVEMADPSTQTQHLKNCQSVTTKPYCLCQYCGLMVQKIHGHLKTHLKYTIPCKFDGCKSKFRTNHCMNNHYRIVHLGFRKWPCTFEGCTFGANTKGCLKGHIDMIHLKIRRFPCPWEGCDKSFFQKKHLDVHLRIHEDVRYLTCELCDYACRQRAAMNWHMNKKHGQGPDPTAKKKAGSSKLKDQMSEQNIPVGVPAPWHHRKRGRKARGKKSKRKNND